MAGRADAERGTGPSGTAPSGDRSSSAAPTVVERVVYRDGGPEGTIELAIGYAIPDGVSRLAFWIERPPVSVVATDGFERSAVEGYTWQGSVDGPAFEWDGSGDRAAVRLRQSLADGDPATYGAGGDDWALCLRPRTHTRWRYRGREPTIDRAASVRGVGVAGEQFALLGDHELHERTGRSKRSGRSERLRLVVPHAADPAAAPERILDVLGDASERLAVGGRSPVVTAFVAPTADVTWRHRGLSLGPDARVNDTAPLSDPTNVWVHEYVHTRQDRAATTADTEWLLEATAEYYGLALAFERGAVDFGTYRDVLQRGVDGDAADAVLADPASWVADAQYRKGALVVAALDRRLRAATGVTFQAVLRAWNERAPEPFDADAFAAAVERAGGPAARAAAVSYTQTAATPACWDETAHAVAFDRSAPGDDASVPATAAALSTAAVGEGARGEGAGDAAADPAAARHR